MTQDEFRVSKSSKGHRVDLWRGGERYVTFADGLTRQGAEREAHSLTALWAKISSGSPPARGRELEGRAN